MLFRSYALDALKPRLRAALVAARPQCPHGENCGCAISTRHDWYIAFCEERERLNALVAAGTAPIPLEHLVGCGNATFMSADRCACRIVPPASPDPAPSGWQPAIIGDMRLASTQVDEADGPAEYQRRMFTLATVARTFLRTLPAVSRPSGEPT